LHKTHQRFYISLPLTLVARVNRWRARREVWTLTEGLETLVKIGLKHPDDDPDPGDN
jgi:hypothetical protein